MVCYLFVSFSYTSVLKCGGCMYLKGLELFHLLNIIQNEELKTKSNKNEATKVNNKKDVLRLCGRQVGTGFFLKIDSAKGRIVIK